MLCSKGCYISVQAGTTPCYDSDSVVGVRHGGSMARKGVMKEHLLQIVSVTAQVAISRRVSLFKLKLEDRQQARRSRGCSLGLLNYDSYVSFRAIGLII